jgi:hypothetical protein
MPKEVNRSKVKILKVVSPSIFNGIGVVPLEAAHETHKDTDNFLLVTVGEP